MIPWVSRPSRARGLKRGPCGVGLLLEVSRPSRARGLKLIYYLTNTIPHIVAPLAGAWIETLILPCRVMTLYCRAPRGRVD